MQMARDHSCRMIYVSQHCYVIRYLVLILKKTERESAKVEPHMVEQEKES